MMIEWVNDHVICIPKMPANPACRRPGLQPEGKRREKVEKSEKANNAGKVKTPGRDVEFSSMVLGE